MIWNIWGKQKGNNSVDDDDNARLATMVMDTRIRTSVHDTRTIMNNKDDACRLGQSWR